MPKLFDRVKVNIGTAGPGTVTFGAASSTAFLTPAQAGAIDGDTVRYVIVDGGDFEEGVGTILASVGQMSRDTVTRSKIGGAFGAAKINLSGTSVLAFTASAADIVNPANHLSELPDKAAARGNLAINAGNTPFMSTGTIAATNVQSAIEELDGENQADHGWMLSAISNRIRVDASQSFSASQQAQARGNLASASVETGAALGLVVNPFREISQENGSTLKSNIGSVTTYCADNVAAVEGSAGTLALSVQNIATPFSGTANFKRLMASTKVIATTAQAAFSASDYAIPDLTWIEGRGFDPLAWGTGDARSIDVLIIFAAAHAGTVTLSARKGDNTRSFVRSINCVAGINVALERIPADTSGSWMTGNSAALSLMLGGLAGTTFQAPLLDVWASGNYTTHASATNWCATTNNYIQVAYLNAFPEGVLPWTSAAQITGEALQRALGIRRSYDEELARSKRFFQKVGIGAIGRWGSPSTCELFARFSVEMRAAPSMSLVSTTPTIIEVGISGHTGSSSALSNTSANPNGWGTLVSGFSGATAGNFAACRDTDIIFANARP